MRETRILITGATIVEKHFTLRRAGKFFLNVAASNIHLQAKLKKLDLKES